MSRFHISSTFVNAAILTFAACMVFLQVFDSAAAGRVTREDGVVEWSTALLYLAAAGLFAWLAWKGPRRGWFWRLGLAVMFVLVAGEEISWGQRLLGFGTPETFENANVQQEFNLHNLDGIHGNVRAAGLLIVGVLCFLMPLADRLIEPVHRLFQHFAVPVFPLQATFAVALAMGFMVYPRIVSGEVVFAMDEVAELFLAVGFFWHAMSTYALYSTPTSARVATPHVLGAANPMSPTLRTATREQ